MADHEQEKGQESLTEREQKAIQELARAIVREAGLTRDPSPKTHSNRTTAKAEAAEKAQEKQRRNLMDFIEAGREGWKAQVDFFKHMATVSGASIVATLAVYKAFDFTKYDTDIGLAAASFFGCALVSLFALYLAHERLLAFSWAHEQLFLLASSSSVDLAKEFPQGKDFKLERLDYSFPPYYNLKLITYTFFGSGLFFLALVVVSHVWPSP